MQGCGLYPVHRRVPQQLQHRVDCPGQIQIHPAPPGHQLMSVEFYVYPLCPGHPDVHQPGAPHDHRLAAGLPGPLQPPGGGDQARGQEEPVQ